MRDLWETRTSYHVVNLEEGLLHKWHANRMVLLGDAAAKV